MVRFALLPSWHGETAWHAAVAMDNKVVVMRQLQWGSQSPSQHHMQWLYCRCGEGEAGKGKERKGEEGQREEEEVQGAGHAWR